MTLLRSLVHTPLANAFGWAIFHSLWLGAIAALILAATLVSTRSARARYAVACAMLLAIFAGFVISLSLSMPSSRPTPVTMIRGLEQSGPGAAGYPQISIGRRLASALPWLTPFWIAGMLLFHLRGFASWTMARRLRLKGVCLAPDLWRERLDRLRMRLGVAKPVQLLETSLAHAPAVIGCLRPVVLVPIGMLAGMPATQIEAILVHELAHIRRHDYLANLLQMVVEGFLFYHPAVWWISHVIRTERENCCDDLVVDVNRNPRDYAAALTVLEENRWAAHQTALAATGGALMKRIRRLLYPHENQRAFLTPVISAGILVLMGALALTAWQAKPVDAYSRWLNSDVAYIVTDQERAAFQTLTTNEERDQFIVQFWKRRNPTPGSPRNPFQIEHYRRIAFANDRFGTASDLPGWKTDRGRIYITFGPPDEIDSHPGGSDGKPPYEVWLYRSIQGIGNDVSMEFTDTRRNGEYRMTMDPNENSRRFAIPRATLSPDKILYDRATRDIDRGDYQAARLTLNTLVNNYGAGEYLAKSKLAIADSWFREGGAHGLAQAEAEYRDFIRFYPKTAEAAEAQFRVCGIQRQQGRRIEDECRAARIYNPNPNSDVPLIQ